MASTEFNYKDYLNKPIGHFDNIASTFGDKNATFHRLSDTNIVIYDTSVKIIMLRTDESNEVFQVSLHFNSILDRTFYDRMIEEHGLPTKMFKPGKLLSESSESSGGITGKQQKISLEETDIENNPFWIIWQKEKFNIQIDFNYSQNSTKLLFTNGQNQVLKNK